MTVATLFPLEIEASSTSPAPEARVHASPTRVVPDDPDAAHGRPHRVGQVLTIPARTALTRGEGSSAGWFDWSANPYCGSEIDGGYGSPRSTHEMSRRGICVKEGFAAALRRDLRSRVRPGEHVAIGVRSDLYPPPERQACVMREALAVLAKASGLRISITTRSNLVLRDADLLREIARRNDLQVHVSVATPDRRLGRLLEPGAPPPALRMATIRALRRNGLRAGVLLTPLLPGVTDAGADLVALLRSARDAGAQFVSHRTVLLEGAARARLHALLRREYPRVAARSEVWARSHGPGAPDVRTEAARRAAAFARELGFGDAVSGTAGPRAPPRPDPLLQRVFRFAGEEP